MKYNIFGLMLLISSFASAMQQNNQNFQQNNQNSQSASVSQNSNPWLQVDDSVDADTPDENGCYLGVFKIPPSEITTFVPRPRTPFVLRRMDWPTFETSLRSNDNRLQHELYELNNNLNNNL